MIVKIPLAMADTVGIIQSPFRPNLLEGDVTFRRMGLYTK